MGSSLGMEYDHPKFYKILKETEPEYREKVRIEFHKLGENSFGKVLGIGVFGGTALGSVIGCLSYREDPFIGLLGGMLFGLGIGMFFGMIGGGTYRIICENKFIKKIEKEVSKQGLENKIEGD